MHVHVSSFQMNITAFHIKKRYHDLRKSLADSLVSQEPEVRTKCIQEKDLHTIHIADTPQTELWRKFEITTMKSFTLVVYGEVNQH